VPFGAGWTDLGYMSEDGVTLTDGRTFEEIRVWQSFYVARRIVTERTFSAAFVMRQWDAGTFSLAFGGAQVTANGAGWRATPPDPSVLDERTVGVEWEDGTKNFRVILRRAMLADNVETKITRTAAADLAVSLTVIAEANVDPWVLDTDDPAFAAVTSP
jgi:hypothetical protein